MSANITDLPRLGDGCKRPPVRRCLFGRPNRENLDRNLSVQENLLTQENDDTKRFRERWGFDPALGKPMEGGDFECTPVDIQSVPSFYSKGYPRRKTKPCSRSMRESSRSPNMMNNSLSRLRSFLDVSLNNNNSNNNNNINSDVNPLSIVRPSVKRRLPLDCDSVNDENQQNVLPSSVSVSGDRSSSSYNSNSRVPMPTDPVVTSGVHTPASSVESSPLSDSCPSPLSLRDLAFRTPQHQTLVKV
ncbi:myosin heavy chain kinase C-like [Aplysia californica]|uniref:Myosin heavy chain kinase C-like n=1 Tax=Aplysia californica TaxID=6500 RepID=A0ABM1W1H3_APLCA|nr:myosin heavy chain kinase C-like [Aplysia californica]